MRADSKNQRSLSRALPEGTGNLVDDVAEGGGVVEFVGRAVVRPNAEVGAIERAEVDNVVFPDELAGGRGLAIDEGAVAAALIDDEAAAAFEHDVGVTARNEGMGEDQVILGQAADGERGVRDGNRSAVGAVDERKRDRGRVRGGHGGGDYSQRSVFAEQA